MDVDLKMTLLPKLFEDLWNYPRNQSLKLLHHRAELNRLPRFSILVGSPGTAKTTVALLLGQYAACERWKSDDLRFPCTECESCRLVYKREHVGAFRDPIFEIDCADKEPHQAIKWIYETERMAHYAKPVGDPVRKRVVILDESHRLKPTEREALLTYVQRAESFNLIATTTSLRDLAIDRDAVPLESDALISRGRVFEFDFPTKDEAIEGLVLSACKVGLVLQPVAAEWIVFQENNRPRQCLERLEELGLFAESITLETIQSVFPREFKASQSTRRSDDRKRTPFVY